VDSSIKNLLRVLLYSLTSIFFKSILRCYWLFQTSTVGNHLYLADFDDSKTIVHVGSHLACFYGGNWLFGMYGFCFDAILMVLKLWLLMHQADVFWTTTRSSKLPSTSWMDAGTHTPAMRKPYNDLLSLHYLNLFFGKSAPESAQKYSPISHPTGTLQATSHQLQTSSSSTTNTATISLPQITSSALRF